MSKRVKIILLVIGVIFLITLLCCCAVAICLYPPVYNALNPNSINNKANKFLSAISQQNYSDAFDLMTFGLKDKVGTPENVPNYIGFQSAIKSFGKYRSAGLDFKTGKITEI